MKKLTVFEFTIISFFISVIISTYIMYLISLDLFVGQIFKFLSLEPLLKLIPLTPDQLWIFSFFFFILVYTLYGLIIAFIIKKGSTAKVIVGVIVLALIAAITVEYKKTVLELIEKQNIIEAQSASIYIPVKKPDKIEEKIAKQYFNNNEAVGDLNSDSIDDIAFIVNRNDIGGSMSRFLIASIASSTGHIGTNIVYIGNKIELKEIKIVDGTINITYLDLSKKNSTTTKHLTTKVSNGILEQGTTTIESLLKK